MKIQFAVVEDFDRLCEKVVDDLCDQKIVAWFQDAGEFGPRALGFRSILADPRNTDIKDYLNNKVKHREWWRPYAPIVLEEFLEEWFETSHISDYMLFSAKVPHETISGVTHEDGTARYQTISKTMNPKAHRLLSKFNVKTGVPVLLNTSFNLGGEPIVETPKDAFKTFKKSNIDVLVMENVYITKTRSSKDGE